MLRSDGRSAAQMRALSIEQGVIQKADGSSRFHCGDNTRVMCAVYGPAESLLKEEQIEKAVIEVIVKPADAKPSDECKAFEGIIRNCLDAVVLRSLHPRTAIRVVVQEMSDDGSRLCAAVNAVFVALLDGGVQLSSTVVAAACAVMNDGRVFVDPTREEEAQAKAVVEFVLELKSQHVADANAKSDEATNTTAKTKDDGSGIGIVASRCRGVLTPAQYAECVSLAEGMAKTVEAFIRKLTEARFK